jgi:signal transduction histidine kinase
LSRWIRRHRNGVTEATWMVFGLVNLDLIVMYPAWETIPFHFIWISLTLIYGFRTWKLGPTLWVLGVVMLLTAVGIAVAVRKGQEPPAELAEVPLMAMVFLATVWHARRRLAAEGSYRLIAAQIARILADQRRFLQDAAHQLRTPITIALGHAELLAGALASDQQEGEDIAVIIGELARLRRISERLLLIAAAADPAFLHPEQVALDELATDLVRRWRPAATRRWRTGTLDSVTVPADRERLALALDALIENAVRHTTSDDAIELAVIAATPGGPARLVVTDTGSGIAASQLPFIFERFNTGGKGRSQGTGLGLPLVAAVAAAHGGTVSVRSDPGKGSEFELLLPTADELPRLPIGMGGLPGRPVLDRDVDHLDLRPRGRPGREPPDGKGRTGCRERVDGAIRPGGQHGRLRWHRRQQPPPLSRCGDHRRTPVGHQYPRPARGEPPGRGDRARHGQRRGRHPGRAGRAGRPGAAPQGGEPCARPHQHEAGVEPDQLPGHRQAHPLPPGGRRSKGV